MMKSLTVGMAAGMVAGLAIASAMPRRHRCHARNAAASALYTMGDMMDRAGHMVHR